ncbi:polysaccharide biosynthesis protein [Crassaminicella indica]|uniref:Polysaccharide biosynthesis protein n=1 Tax=Crassaminicella indica TaxID=2855394 RepID=A0ABX8RD32_9CLOT|nr:nucleoside-diphosphate sugar epimerase/dehydratase [Crassaminicella indica]QXM06676.1 polysaccharide biosynthesis protein [Crassaminicella indica]
MYKKLKPIFIFLLDVILINIAIMMAYYLRFGRNLTFDYFKVFIYMSPFITIGKILVFNYFGLYKSIWKYAGIDELMNLFMAVSISNGLIIIAIYLGRLNVPRSIYVITFFIDLFLFGISRFTTKIFKRINIYDMIYFPLKDKRKRVMIIGAGEAGNILLKKFKEDARINPICFIDDDLSKKGKKISGVPIVGTRQDIFSYAVNKKIDEIVIAIPGGKRQDIKEIIEECKKTKSTLKILPNIHELRELKEDLKEILADKIRNVDVNDLLGRDKVQLDDEKIAAYINGKRVLVTGGGGSIGSELCRQIVKFKPEKLIVFDISENNLYDIQEELNVKYPNVDKSFMVGSVRDVKRLNYIFSSCSPHIVFHAAAHKHVPLMEDSCGEAVKNNVFGTLNVVKMSDRYHVEKFILISSDKAVNPTNVMGATKRICEMIVQSFNKNSKTDFVAVRFGNVLGSRGSVIPLFKKQIARGGPVTVTHPDIIRYFMTISEAVQLVMESAAMAKGGEIFVLDMGEPVKIDQLARDLITLSGFEPDKDIEIKYTGLRPGEKLYEELLVNDENVEKTHKEKIYVEKPMDIEYYQLMKDIDALKKCIDSDPSYIKNRLKRIVPTYKENNKL